jgi:hypothetical protein
VSSEPTAVDNERHRRVARVLAAGGPRPSGELRARVADVRTRRAERRSVDAPRLGLALAAAAILALVLVLAVQVLRPAPEATSERFAALAQEPASAPPPAPDAQPGLLDERFAGVVFPDWSGLDWYATGTRTDRIDGREAHTVFYEHHGHRVSYTVVDGAPLDVPEDARPAAVPGMAMWAFEDGSRDVVTFVRHGRTCVVAGDVLERSTLLELAAWRAGGALTI